jgi:hypothetical protein
LNPLEGSGLDRWTTETDTLPEILYMNPPLKPRKISVTLVMSDKHSSKYCVADECRYQSEGFSTYVVFSVVDCREYGVWLTTENMECG